MPTITIVPYSAQPLTVSRLGHGTMRLTGPEIWGEPADRPQALAILRKAVESGVNFLDTADYYGQDVTNRLITEALHPYPANPIISTKVGATRRPDKSWVPFNTPENLRTAIDNNLRTLRQEQIQLVHLRLMGHGAVPLDEQLGAMFELQREGKIRHVGLSNVTCTELEAGLALGEIATVEDRYAYSQRTTVVLPYGTNPGGEEVLDLCEAPGIPLIPFFALINSLPKAGQNRRNCPPAPRHRRPNKTGLAAAQVALDTTDSGYIVAGAPAGEFAGN